MIGFQKMFEIATLSKIDTDRVGRTIMCVQMSGLSSVVLITWQPSQVQKYGTQFLSSKF